MRIIVFGTGKMYARYKEKLNEMNIVVMIMTTYLLQAYITGQEGSN